MGIPGDKMISILPQTVNTYTNSSRSMVASLIRDMKVDKIQFNSLINKMSSFTSGARFAAQSISPLSPLNKEILVDLFRDSSFRMNSYFNAINSVGLALSSMVDVISSEIEKVEKDLENLEIYINNYEFLSGKDDQFNSNYLEKFDSYLNSYLYDGYNFIIPDRDGTNFSDNFNSFIDSKKGSLGIGTGLISRNLINNIKGITIKSNYENSITSSTDFINLINDSLTDSWNITIKSPTILTSQLTEYLKYIDTEYQNDAGAKTAVEVTLQTPVYMNTVRINPNYGSELTLDQIIIFSDNPLGEVIVQDLDNQGNQINSFDIGSNYEKILKHPKTLERTLDISFSPRSVNKIIFLFNQRVYSRSKAVPIISELNSKLLTAFIDELIQEKRAKFSLLQDIVYWFFRKKNTISGVSKNKNVTDTYYSYRFPLEIDTYLNVITEEIFRINNLDLEDRQSINSTPFFIDIFYNMLRHVNADNFSDFSNYYIESTGSKNSQIYADYPGFIPVSNSDIKYDNKFQFYERIMARGNSRDVLKKLLIEESSDAYEYSFSLKSIEFFEDKLEIIDGPQFRSGKKACYVSKRIPVEGQIQAVKAKIELVNNTDENETRFLDLKNLTSYELSISNSELPVSELDWIPILHNSSEQVDSEVVFFNTVDYSGQLRFNASQDSITLYKDGILCSPNTYTYNPVSNKIQLLQQNIYSEFSVFVVSYKVNKLMQNPHEINFETNNIFKQLVKRYATSEGIGQVFAKTNSSNSVTLDYNPYINQNFTQNATYSAQSGTIFAILSNVPVYSPIKIRLSDGSFAINLTNYTNKTQKVEFYNTDLTLFIQSGKNIIFNKLINSPFRVDYEYVPYNLRFRTIIRQNMPNNITSGKIDSVLLKMKTAKFDNYYNRINSLHL